MFTFLLYLSSPFRTKEKNGIPSTDLLMEGQGGWGDHGVL